jgi:hypothetical protein
MNITCPALFMEAGLLLVVFSTILTKQLSVEKARCDFARSLFYVLDPMHHDSETSECGISMIGRSLPFSSTRRITSTQSTASAHSSSLSPLAIQSWYQEPGRHSDTGSRPSSSANRSAMSILSLGVSRVYGRRWCWRCDRNLVIGFHTI